MHGSSSRSPPSRRRSFSRCQSCQCRAQLPLLSSTPLPTKRLSFGFAGAQLAQKLKELDEEDIEALAAKLKKVQAKKFTKKIAALRA